MRTFWLSFYCCSSYLAFPKRPNMPAETTSCIRGWPPWSPIAYSRLTKACTSIRDADSAANWPTRAELIVRISVPETNSGSSRIRVLTDHCQPMKHRQLRHSARSASFIPSLATHLPRRVPPVPRGVFHFLATAFLAVARDARGKSDQAGCQRAPMNRRLA